MALARPETAAAAPAAAAECGDEFNSGRTPGMCDCLNACGDDDRLLDGRAEPCAYRKLLLGAQQEQERDIATAEALIESLHRSRNSDKKETAAALNRLLTRVRRIVV